MYSFLVAISQQISIHDLTRRSTQCIAPFLISMLFQFTTSQGGRLIEIPLMLGILVFQFTTSQGGRPARRALRPPEQYFNSRPHKEVDVLFDSTICSKLISIHDLTRRSTIPKASDNLPATFQFTTSQGGRQDIETAYMIIIIFQFTTSQGGRLRGGILADNTKGYFNSRPHKEVDRTRSTCFYRTGISIHDLTRRSTAYS